MSYLKNFYLIFFIVFSFIISGCEGGRHEEKNELTISAAASLKEALEDAGNSYMEKNPDVRIVYNFGGSGSLQQQIAQGAPVDLFISAAEDKYNLLLSKKLIDKNHSVQLLGNELVLIFPKSNKSIDTVEALLDPDIERIAIGTPQTVPAGMYARQALASAGIWDQLEGKIINTKDVRQVLSYVETANVDAGIVYKTDAMISDKIKWTPIQKQYKHDSIIYPAGVVTSSKHQEEAIRFLSFLESEKAMAIFKKYGFSAALD